MQKIILEGKIFSKRGEGIMMKKRKKTGFFLAGMMLAATIVTTGCGGGNAGADDAADAAENNVLVVAQGADAISLDPHATNDNPSAVVMRHLYETLVSQNEDMEIQPGLAEDWRQIDDYTWEFDLRDDVYFHNGEQLTAQDVKFTFTRAVASAVISPIVGDINPDSIEVIDDHTVRVGTNEPFAPFLAHLAHPASAILSEVAVEELGDDFGQNPVGTGPFKFVNWNVGDSIELVRNEEFHGELPQFEELIIRNITENSSRTVELETGQVDIALDIAPIDVERVANHEDLVLHRRQNLATMFVYLNMENEPFNDVRVRQAINYALRVDEIIEAVLEGVGETAQAPIAPIVWGANPNLGQYPNDVERAKELLAEAGFEDGFSTTIMTNENQTRVDIATIMRNQLEEIGIDIDISVLEWAVYTDAVDAGEHDMAILGWVAVTGDADYGLFPMFHSSQRGAAGNRSFFANDRVDELLEAARQTTNEEERLAAYHEVQEIVMDEAAKVWLNHGEVVVGTQDNIVGFSPSPAGHHNFATVYFQE